MIVTRRSYRSMMAPLSRSLIGESATTRRRARPAGFMTYGKKTRDSAGAYDETQVNSCVDHASMVTAGTCRLRRYKDEDTNGILE
jgi:hypothetical protein